MLSSCNPASKCTARYHFLAAFASFVVASVVAGVGWGGWCGRLKVTRGGLGMVCFSFLEACSMGRCCLIFSSGW